MRVLSTLADRLLGAFAGKATAQAVVCEYRKCGFQGTGLRQCCLRNGVWVCGGCYPA